MTDKQIRVTKQRDFWDANYWRFVKHRQAGKDCQAAVLAAVDDAIEAKDPLVKWIVEEA